MIALGGTSKARESCDQTKSWSVFSLHSQGENALGVFTLWTLKWLDVRMRLEQRARFVIESNILHPSTAEFPEAIAPPGYKALLLGQTRDDAASPVRLCYEVTWKRAEIAGPPLDLFKLANDRFCVVSIELISEASINE